MNKCFIKECKNHLFLIFILIFTTASCNENFHITANQKTQENIFSAKILGSNTGSLTGINNAKIGVIGQFTDDTTYNDDGSAPATREKEWIFKVNNSEVGRINFQTLATSITNTGVNVASTHSQLIVDDWIVFLNDVSGSTAGTDLILGDEICVSSIVKNSNSETSSPSTSVCFSPPQRQAYSFTGSDQAVASPAGSSQILIKAWGAGGGSGGSASGGKGGPGGYSEIKITAQNGTVLVGQGGIGGSAACVNTTYGFGGRGGQGGSTDCEGSGGGLSGFFSIASPVLSTDSASALIIAGGGGGGVLNSGNTATGGPGNQTSSAGGSPLGMLGVDGPTYGDTTTASAGQNTAGGGGGLNGGEHFPAVGIGAGGERQSGRGGTGQGDIMQSASLGDTLPANSTDIDYTTGVGEGTSTAGDRAGHGSVIIYFIP